MKKNLLHFYIFITVLFSDYLIFAQEGETTPGDETAPGDEPLESGDDLAAPINGKLIFLAISGILFAFYIYKRNRQTA